LQVGVLEVWVNRCRGCLAAAAFAHGVTPTMISNAWLEFALR